MSATLQKYRHVFGIGLQNALVYRWNFLVRAFFALFQLCIVFILWGAAYVGRKHIGGFSLDETLTYFVVVMLVNFCVGSFTDDFQVSEEIRNGLINQFLTKPINYYLYRLTLFGASRIVSAALILIPFLFVLPWLAPHLTIPNDPWRWAAAIPAIAFSGMIQFTMAYCFGLLSFWVLEITGFVILSFAIETLLSGQVFPLDLMPPAIFHLAQFLPFYYQMYFPVALITGRLDVHQVLSGLATQAAWVALFALIAQIQWKAGLRKYTAVGG